MQNLGLIEAGGFFFVLGAVLSFVPNATLRAWTFVLSLLGAVSFLVAGVGALAKPLDIYSWESGPISLAFGIDPLSGFFTIALSVLCIAVSIYSIGYLKHLRYKGLMPLLFNLFVLSIYAVFASKNAITFLIAWEAMSIVSYFLVTFQRDDTSAKAGLVYAVMTHIGTAFIIFLFLLLYSYSKGMDFSSMREIAPNMPQDIKNIVFIFSIIGFGTKAGIVPIHTWLPRAHPAAPSNISALMSGVMIKTGIYGLLRVGIDILGGGPQWWGITILIIGAISSVLGVMYALMEHDLKRLLAYHSVENIGIILLGIGASMLFKSHGLYTLSAIALVAGLYHVLNHAVFKGLLFLGAGSVLNATHTKDMEELGGLIKKMPYTGLFFLIGSISICALPPFNGFVSEWLIYQSLLLGFKIPSVTAKIISPLGGAALALTGALAAACFVKAFGISFLGMPRSAHSESAKESSPSMVLGMAILALLCLLLGVFPQLVLGITTPISFMITGSYGIAPSEGSIFLKESGTGLSPQFLLITMIIMAIATMLFIYTVGGRKKITLRGSWDCGIPHLTPRMQYSATAFTKPIRMIFKQIYLPRREISVSYIVKPFFVKSIRYSGEITPFFERYLYEPGINLIHRVAGKIRLLQSGSLHLYLGYILITLIILLVFWS